jgi:hypothetical protein
MRASCTPDYQPLQPLLPFFLGFSITGLVPVAAPRASSRHSFAIDRAASWSVAAVSIALFRHSSARFFAASTTLPALPLQPLPAALFTAFSVPPALGLAPQPLPAAAALPGSEIPPALIRPAIPIPASSFFISLLFMSPLHGVRVDKERNKGHYPDKKE